MTPVTRWPVESVLEPLVSLAAAAAVTERIGLATTVLLGPLRVNPVALAKQAASVHKLSGGRMTLGIGLGARDDDYEISGVATSTRGKDLDAMLERMQEVWEGEELARTTRRRRASAAKDPETVKQYVAAYESAGCQDLFLFPSSSDPQQVDLLAEALGM